MTIEFRLTMDAYADRTIRHLDKARRANHLATLLAVNQGKLCPGLAIHTRHARIDDPLRIPQLVIIMCNPSPTTE